VYIQRWLSIVGKESRERILIPRRSYSDAEDAVGRFESISSVSVGILMPLLRIGFMIIFLKIETSMGC